MAAEGTKQVPVVKGKEIQKAPARVLSPFEDIEITLTGNLITVKGETKKEEKEEKGDFYRCEISHGAFSRTVSLPAEVDDSKAKASLTEGVLEVTLSKVEKAKKRAIKVA